jgi:hypothetical protein
MTAQTKTPVRGAELDALDLLGPDRFAEGRLVREPQVV